MPGLRRKIGLRDVRALEPNQELWDRSVSGFGARRQRSEAVAYVLLYRTSAGRSRRYTIGRHGAPWTPDTAREEARRLLVEVSQGADPAAEKKLARNVSTVSELCDLYLEDAEAGRLLTRRGQAKRLSTLVSDRGRIAGHIKPLLGAMAVAAVTSQDVRRFMHAVAEGKTAARAKTEKNRGLSNLRGGEGVASRSVGLLGAIFTYAILNGMRVDNPVRGVTRFADGRRDRRLSDEEYGKLGRAIASARKERIWEPAVAVVEFLALTGWRSGEALGLLWREVNLERRTVRLSDTKSGASVRPLSSQACDVLRTRSQADKLVFPPTRGDKLMTGFPKIWARIAKLGALAADITPHVFRHSFSSLAADLGYSEPTIAALIGHKGHTVTSRYIHAADEVLLAAAEAIAAQARSRIYGTAILAARDR